MKIAVSAIGQAVPGHLSPDAGFEAPFEMLTACHERVHRMLALLQRLRQHLATQGWDTSAADAARDVMRYFDLAAPLHHEDEERHVFPVLLRSGDDTLRQVVRRLKADHLAMTAAWPPARALLQSVVDADAQTPWSVWDAPSLAVLDAFSDRYGEHIRLEEEQVYPAAQRLLDDATVREMSHDMQQRRRTPPPLPSSSGAR